MKKLVLLSLLTLASAAFAQNAPLEGISESTDPGKVRDVERRAEEIRSRQQSASSGASDTAQGQAAGNKKSGKHMHDKEMKKEMKRKGNAS